MIFNWSLQEEWLLRYIFIGLWQVDNILTESFRRAKLSGGPLGSGPVDPKRKAERRENEANGSERLVVFDGFPLLAAVTIFSLLFRCHWKEQVLELNPKQFCNKLQNHPGAALFHQKNKSGFHERKIQPVPARAGGVRPGGGEGGRSDEAAGGESQGAGAAGRDGEEEFAKFEVRGSIGLYFLKIFERSSWFLARFRFQKCFSHLDIVKPGLPVNLRFLPQVAAPQLDPDKEAKRQKRREYRERKSGKPRAWTGGISEASAKIPAV